MIFNRKNVRMGDLLVESGAITSQQLEEALNRQKGTDKKLGEILVDAGIITEENIAEALSHQLRLEIVDLQNLTIDKSILNLVQVGVLKKNVVIPFEFKEGNLCVIGKALILSPPFPPPHTVRESFLLIRRSNELLHLLNW